MLDALVVLPAGVCVGCAASGRRPGRVPGTVAAALMLVAMIDTGIGPGVLPTLVWAAVLTVAGIALAVAGRAGAVPHASHGAVGLVLMAALVIAMPAGTPMASMPGMGASPFAGVVLVASAAFAIASAVLVARERSVPRRIESGAMAVSVALMALPLVL